MKTYTASIAFAVLAAAATQVGAVEVEFELAQVGDVGDTPLATPTDQS